MENQEVSEKEKANAATIEHRLIVLQEEIDNKQFREFWETVRDLNNYIRTLDYISREDRAKFRLQIDSLCNEAKQGQQVHQEEKDRNYKLNSEKKKQYLLGMIKEALSINQNLEGIERSRHQLDEATEYLRNGIPAEIATAAGLDESPMTKEDRDVCWAQCKEAKEEIIRRREVQKKINFETIRRKISDAKTGLKEGDPYDTLDALKAIRSQKRELLLDREQHDELNKLIDECWEQGIVGVNARKSEKQERHKQWVLNMKEKLGHLENVITRNETYITEIELQIEELKEKIPTTHSTMHQERINEWIEEKYKRIEEVKLRIEEVQGKITDIKMKMERD